MKKFAILCVVLACFTLSFCYGTDENISTEIINDDVVVASSLTNYLEETGRSENQIDDATEEISHELFKKDNDENLNNDLPLHSHLFSVAVLVFLLARFFNHIGDMGTSFKILPSEKLQYVKTLQLEGITPGQAAFMADTISVKTADIFKASLIKLVQKGILSFEFVGTETQIEIIEENADLEVEEAPIFAFIAYYLKARGNTTRKFLLSDLEKYMQSNSQKVAILRKRVMATIKSAIPFYDAAEHARLNKLTRNIVTYTALALATYVFCSSVPISLMAIPTWVYIMIFINILCCVRIISQVNLFDQVGTDNREKFKAFKKYMSEFSTKDLGTPRIESWERYAPYAAAFGIGKIVIGQLKKAYPSLQESYLRDMLVFYQRLDECDIEKSFIQSASASLLMI